MKTLVFKPVTLCELDILCNMEKTYFVTDRLSRRQFMRFIKNNRIWGAFFGETIIGYCIMLSKQNSSKLRLYSIVITTDFQGQGIWHSLLDYAIVQFQKVKSYTDVTLEVAVTNKKALAAYKRYGFVITKNITSYYQDGTDAYRMSKKLSGSC